MAFPVLWLRAPVRILHVISAYPPSRGGAQLHARELARQQVRSGDEVHVATVWRTSRKDWLRGTTLRAPAPGPTERDDDAVVVHPTGLTSAQRWGSALPALGYYGAMRAMAPGLTAAWRRTAERVVEQVAPDVAHLSRIGREGFYQAMVDALDRRRIPWVLTPNHHPHWTRRRDWWWWRLYRAAGAVLVFSDAERDMLRAGGVPGRRIVRSVVGPVGVDVPTPPPLPAEPRVVFVGQVRRYKRLDLVADAIDLLRREGVAATLDVVGPWVDDQPRLRRRLEEAPHVHVHGAVDDAVRDAALRGARVLCVPSTEESLGGVHLEAWTWARPTVGADIPPTRELFDRAGGGIAVATTPRAVADALRRLLLDDELCQDLARRGRRAVEEQFNWDVAAQRARQAYALAGAEAVGH